MLRWKQYLPDFAKIRVGDNCLKTERWIDEFVLSSSGFKRTIPTAIANTDLNIKLWALVPSATLGVLIM